MPEITLANGKKYTFAPLAFTEGTVRLFCLYEQLQDEAARETFKYSELLSVLQVCMKDSLSQNHSPAEIQEALRAIPMTSKGQTLLMEISGAMLNGD